MVPPLRPGDGAPPPLCVSTGEGWGGDQGAQDVLGLNTP